MGKSGNNLEIDTESIKTKREVNIDSIMASSVQGMDHQEQPLSPPSRLFHEPRSNLYLIVLFGVKGRINPDVVKAEAAQTLCKHPRFSSLQVVDEEKGNGMKWVPTKVDIENHIIVPDIDPNMESPEKFVEDYIADLGKTGIEKSRPLWDIHILNVKTIHADAVSILRMHHSLGDGMSITSFLLSFTRKASDPEALPTLPAAKKSNANNFKGFWATFWLVWNTIIDVVMVVVTGLFLKDTNTPLRPHAGHGPTPWRFVHRTVSLDDIKLVKNSMNATINDVVVGVTQAGLSRYMNRIYGNTKKSEGNSEKMIDYLPKNIRLTANLIVNIRPSAGIPELEELMKKDAKMKWGNKFGFVLLPFNMALRDDPLDYVRNAKATNDRKKHSMEAIFTFNMISLGVNIFGAKVGSYLYHRISTHASMVFSNVMGPVEEIIFFGNEVVYLVPGCFGTPNALMIHCHSYANKISFGITFDERAILDPHQLCDDIEESLEHIKKVVIAADTSKR